MTTADLLEASREATRAAELAKRLAEIAADTADQVEKDSLASEDLAAMARARGGGRGGSGQDRSGCCDGPCSSRPAEPRNTPT